MFDIVTKYEMFEMTKDAFYRVSLETIINSLTSAWNNP